jgi:hypothetical protein
MNKLILKEEYDIGNVGGPNDDKVHRAIDECVNDFRCKGPYGCVLTDASLICGTNKVLCSSVVSFKEPFELMNKYLEFRYKDGVHSKDETGTPTFYVSDVNHTIKV